MKNLAITLSLILFSASSWAQSQYLDAFPNTPLLESEIVIDKDSSEELVFELSTPKSIYGYNFESGDKIRLYKGALYSLEQISDRQISGFETKANPKYKITFHPDNSVASLTLRVAKSIEGYNVPEGSRISFFEPSECVNPPPCMRSIELTNDMSVNGKQAKPGQIVNFRSPGKKPRVITP